ncbi:MAG: hypothetical protein MJ252_30415, partial [archaeon]|nr:hypothetical protein [archaeon]
MEIKADLFQTQNPNQIYKHNDKSKNNNIEIHNTLKKKKQYNSAGFMKNPFYNEKDFKKDHGYSIVNIKPHFKEFEYKNYGNQIEFKEFFIKKSQMSKQERNQILLKNLSKTFKEPKKKILKPLPFINHTEEDPYLNYKE